MSDAALERRADQLGHQFLHHAAAAGQEAGRVDRWIAQLLARISDDASLRVQLLRFVDLLPAVQDDAELLRLFDEYFDGQELPLPGAARLVGGIGRVLGDNTFARAVRAIGERLSGQFMGGRSLAELGPLLDSLSAGGREVSLDLLGEATLSEVEAERYRQAYAQLLDDWAVSRPGQPPHLSIKLSSLQPRLRPLTCDADAERVLARLYPLLLRARELDASVTLDMEDVDKQPLIFAVLRRLLFDDRLRDWPGIGVAVQAYLIDAEAQLEQLLDWAERRGTPFTIRLVRGAYWDQERILAGLYGWPMPVQPTKPATDASYERCLARLLAAAGRVCPAIATHNPRSIALALALAERHRLGRDGFEFQMLYGMAGHYQQAVLDMGQRLRLYVPFGEPIPGMAYLVRRLLENASSQSLLRLQPPRAEDFAELLAAPAPLSTESAAPSVGGQASFANQPLHRFVDAAERASFAAAIEQVRGQLGDDHRLLLDGQWRDGEGSIESFDPAQPQRLVGRVAHAGAGQVEQALAAARRACPGWREMPVEQRSALLRRAADALQRRRDEFATWQVFEAGKGWTEADADVCEAIDFLRYYAAQAERLNTADGIALAGEDNRLLFESRGVGVVIPPWNFPLAILTGLLSATLVTGNCAILKPASDTPVVAARLTELLHGLGLPDGVLQLLPGAGGTVGEALVRHPDVQLIAFTGSRAVGQRILRHAATWQPQQRHIKQVIAELGGKNAIIVDASADPDEAIAGILQSAFGFQGQKCSACSRVIVVGGQYRSFARRLAEAAEGLRIGPPESADSELGPVINGAARERIEQVIEAGARHGRLLYRAEVGQRPGHYVGPALFVDVEPRSPLAQQEVFGPVLSLIAAADFERALALANDTDYALTGGVYSRSPTHLQQARREFRVGNLYLNRGITGALVGRQPFGGFRLSGTASKAGGADYLRLFMRQRCVTENTLRRGFAPDS